MNTNKRLKKGALAAVVLSFTLFGIVSAQHMGQSTNMGQNTMQHMDQQMMGMQQMMNNVDNMMDRTSGMMDAMHDMNNMDNNGSGDHMNHDTYDMGAGHNMGGNGGNMGDNNGGNMGDSNGGMMNMIQNMDEITNNMKSFMSQMNNMMNDEEMMDDQLMNQYMENMQEYMNTVMEGYDGVISQMEKIQILNTK